MWKYVGISVYQICDRGMCPPLLEIWWTVLAHDSPLHLGGQTKAPENANISPLFYTVFFKGIFQTRGFKHRLPDITTSVKFPDS